MRSTPEIRKLPNRPTTGIATLETIEEQGPREIGVGRDTGVRYSICTIVNDRAVYDAEIAQFRARGFSTADCEYLFADNTVTNRYDAYEAYNLFLGEARGRYIILCHQDLVLLEDDRTTLDRLLAGLDAHDPDWALCGNAGARPDGTLAIRITDPNTPDASIGGPFPTEVVGLDENFIVVRRDANLAVSHDLHGYHLYGSDLCIVADLLGRPAYVIDFHLRHLSGGSPDDTFHRMHAAMTAKYRRAFRSRWQYVTTERPLYLSGSPARRFIARVGRRLSRRSAA